ncbi:MAG: spore coat associated protein CotJA [Desulfocucumaceae bacterium]
MNGSKRRPLVWTWPPSPGKYLESHGKTAEVAGQYEEQLLADQQAEVQPAAVTEEAPVEAVATEAERAAESQAYSPEEKRVPPSATNECFPSITGPEPGCCGMQLATAYIPYQKYGPIFSPREALEKGTLFPDLYSPYPY